MYFQDVLDINPQFSEFTTSMPEQLDGHFVLKEYDNHAVIHQKGTRLERIGILLEGKFRVVNELENGSVFMIEENRAISFVGEVALLAGAPTTSVTIETVAPCKIAFLPLNIFNSWINSDIVFLRKLSEHVALKLYCCSYNRGERQFYSTKYLLLKYIDQNAVRKGENWILNKTRQTICEEEGITVKTINRTLAHFQEEGIIDIKKGKVVLSDEQKILASASLKDYMKQSRNGN